MERWLPVAGFPGYEVSDQGRVRSNKRGGRILSLEHTKNSFSGYHRVTLYHKGPHRVSVHRLVLETFVGPCPPGLQGCHANDDGTDNRLSNLRWGTPSSNSDDCIRNGRHPSYRKTECPSGHAYDEANTHITKAGARHCRKCHADREARRRRRQRVSTPAQLEALAKARAARRAVPKRERRI